MRKLLGTYIWELLLTEKNEWISQVSRRYHLSKFPLLFLICVKEAVMVVTKVTRSFPRGNISIIGIALHDNIVADFF